MDYEGSLVELSEKGLDRALARLLGATDCGDELIAFSETINWIHRLEGAHVERLGNRYYQERDRRQSGQLVGGIVYARNFDHHRLVLWVDSQGGAFSDVFTDRFGTLCWKELALVPRAKPDPKYARDSYYRIHLEMKPVPDTLLVGQRFLTEEITQVN